MWDTGDFMIESTYFSLTVSPFPLIPFPHPFSQVSTSNRIIWNWRKWPCPFYMLVCALFWFVLVWSWQGFTHFVEKSSSLQLCNYWMEDNVLVSSGLERVLEPSKNWFFVNTVVEQGIQICPVFFSPQGLFHCVPLKDITRSLWPHEGDYNTHLPEAQERLEKAVNLLAGETHSIKLQVRYNFLTLLIFP